MTRTSAESAKPTEAPITSHPSLDRSRFVPGAVLDKRYRIVGLLGRGGMGEVYRADDMKLGQPVALKFLPQGLERDENRLTRFLNEVRTARQVTHSSVCRVFDIAEVDGQHYLSMEYVDGEDLSSLLRRIGRIPKDKAMQVARQLCAGVQAAHGRGILHRDLKPANVMIDGRGQVKITDFGLAGLGETIQHGEIRSGTPAYMAPEQFAGKEVTVRSDIYALGLVLYELFTGKQAFEATTPTELAELHRNSAPTNPSSLVEGFDPAIERVLLRCLEKEPRDRPASALAVAAELPGGDPLAAAVAAGETPSPEMVADAGGGEGLRPSVAAICLAVLFSGLAAVPLMSGKVDLARRISLDLPPEALTLKAREIVREAGYTDPFLDSARGFAYDWDHLRHLDDEDPSLRWRGLADERPAPIYFWYRQSPRYLTATGFDPSRTGSEPELFPLVAPDDPPPVLSGMVGVRLDTRGRLLRFDAVPPQVDDSPATGEEPRWSALFDRAGIELAAVTAVEPTRNSLGGADERKAWKGAYPDGSRTPFTIEAGSYRGRPTYFEVVTPWTRPQRMVPRTRPPGHATWAVVTGIVFATVLAGALLLARRNLRRGRGDRLGAFRVALLVFVGGMLYWAMVSHHQPTGAESDMFFDHVAVMLLWAGFVWLIYVALEPFLRRIWPEALISWNRFIRGGLHDPRVGRDLLIGGTAAVIVIVLEFTAHVLPGSMDLPLKRPSVSVTLTGLRGVREAIGFYPALVMAGLTATFFPLFQLVVLRVILRRTWAAAVAVVLLHTFVGTLSATNPAIEAPIFFLMSSLEVFVLVRFGILASWSRVVFFAALRTPHPYTWDLSSWYAGRSILTLALLAAIAVYAFRVALAGRPLFRGDLFDVASSGKP